MSFILNGWFRIRCERFNDLPYSFPELKWYGSRNTLETGRKEICDIFKRISNYYKNLELKTLFQIVHFLTFYEAIKTGEKSRGSKCKFTSFFGGIDDDICPVFCGEVFAMRLNCGHLRVFPERSMVE